MSKVIRCKLDSASIGQAIKELQDYRKGLEDKIRQFVESLANDGVEVAKAWIMASQGNSEKPTVSLQVNPAGDITRAQITMTGKDVLFVEFGAGIHYNGNDTPHAAKFGYGVGTYNPSSDNAFNPDGWYYWTGTERVHSYGTEGTYPLYHAVENARNTAIKKAIEIFSRS